MITFGHPKKIGFAWKTHMSFSTIGWMSGLRVPFIGSIIRLPIKLFGSVDRRPNGRNPSGAFSQKITGHISCTKKKRNPHLYVVRLIGKTPPPPKKKHVNQVRKENPPFWGEVCSLHGPC